jgi:hypothetical protein
MLVRKLIRAGSGYQSEFGGEIVVNIDDAFVPFNADPRWVHVGGGDDADRRYGAQATGTVPDAVTRHGGFVICVTQQSLRATSY